MRILTTVKETFTGIIALVFFSTVDNCEQKIGAQA
jgi:hypothetical protein